jgi:hypothetical protein
VVVVVIAAVVVVVVVFECVPVSLEVFGSVWRYSDVLPVIIMWDGCIDNHINIL